jgi:hypothetical protein
MASFYPIRLAPDPVSVTMPRAGIENVFDPVVQGLDKRQSAGLLHYRDSSNARATINVIVKPRGCVCFRPKL